MRLSGGDSLLVHLGMSGRISVLPDSNPPPIPHEHVVLVTDNGCAYRSSTRAASAASTW